MGQTLWPPPQPKPKPCEACGGSGKIDRTAYLLEESGELRTCRLCGGVVFRPPAPPPSQRVGYGPYGSYRHGGGRVFYA